MHLSPGTILGGQYRIVRFIARGGYGCTYQAEHVYLKQTFGYAIKEFFPASLCNRDSATNHVTVAADANRELVTKLRMKFIDEANALAAMSHPGIPKIYGVFEENGTAYFVMEYIDGISLSQMLNQQGALPENVACRYIRQAAEILRFVHSNNRLHLDLKPANIMIGPDDRPVLIDFGVSKQYDEANGQNTSTLTGSTPGFAPPEQMTNRVKKFFPATDIYSLGATLYDILTNEAPPSVDDLISGLDTLNIPTNVSASTKAAIEKAMQLRVSDRPQTIDEFLAILDGKGARAIRYNQIHAPSPSPSPSPRETETDLNCSTPKPIPHVSKRTYAGNASSKMVGDATDVNDSTVISVISVPAAKGYRVNGQKKPLVSSCAEKSVRTSERLNVGQRRVYATKNYALGKKTNKIKILKIISIVIIGAIIAFLATKVWSNEDKSYIPMQNEAFGETISWSSETQTLTFGKYSYKMVAVEGGTFMMGNNEVDAHSDEAPVHRVILNNYSIGATEVPQWLWNEVMNSNPSNWEGDNLPVENVSWEDCQNFINKLNKKTGANFRFPTEAEWEFAARGGNRSNGYKYSGSDDIGDVAWYENNSGSCTHEVGTKTANELGLYDMSGNVWEWCNDWYDSCYFRCSNTTNPIGPSSGSIRVYRGGGWRNDATFCRIARRSGCSPRDCSIGLGFRLAL